MVGKRWGVVLAAAVGLATGCGDDPHGDDPQSNARAETSRELARAGEKTRAAGNARFVLDIAIDGGTEQAKLSMQGATYTGRPGMSGTMTIDESLGANLPVGTKIRFINYGNKFWVLGPGQDLWVRTPTNSSPSVPDDLATALRTLGSVNDDVRSEGREMVRGAPTMHYRASTDLEEYRDSLPESDRDDYEEKLEKYDLERLPLEIWVGDDGLVRRLLYDISVEQGTTKAKIVGTYDLFDFGKEEPEPPPAPGEVATSGGTP